MEKTGDFQGIMGILKYYISVYFPHKRFVIRNDTMCSLKGMDIQYPYAGKIFRGI